MLFVLLKYHHVMYFQRTDTHTHKKNTLFSEEVCVCVVCHSCHVRQLPKNKKPQHVSVGFCSHLRHLHSHAHTHTWNRHTHSKKPQRMACLVWRCGPCKNENHLKRQEWNKSLRIWVSTLFYINSRLLRSAVQYEYRYESRRQRTWAK